MNDLEGRTYPVHERSLLSDVKLGFAKCVASFDLQKSSAFVLVAKASFETDKDGFCVKPMTSIKKIYVVKYSNASKSHPCGSLSS